MRSSLAISARLAIGLILAIGNAAVADVIDQSYPAMSLGQEIGVGVPGDPIVAQSFTVGMDGELSAVKVLISRDAGNAVGDLIAEIRPVVAGVPGDAASALASVTIAALSVPVLDIPAGYEPTQADLFSILYDAPNVSVTSGDSLAIVLSTTVTGGYSWVGSCSDGYPRGGRFYDIGSGFVSTSDDLYFQTLVGPETPEPSTVVMLCMCPVGLLVCGRQKRRHG